MEIDLKGPGQGAHHPALTFHIDSTLGAGRIRVHSDPGMRVSRFLRAFLAAVRTPENAERIDSMQGLYEPELLLQGEGEEMTPIPGEALLSETGLTPDSVCRIGAIPIKSRNLFCAVCGNNKGS